MIPVRLHLSGFLSYLDPVDLDFSSFELACISGSNGAGKSSLLDAITWALFGQARRRDDAVIHSHAKQAEVIFDMGYEGELYRIQRIKQRDKATVLEFFIKTAEGWRTLTERAVRDTEMRIQQTLRMDYETFINASFFLQGKADLFAQQRPGDRKRILGSILGLEVWETYRQGAAERRKRLDNEVNGVDSLLEEINAELRQEPERRERLKTMEEQLGQLQNLRMVQETSLGTLRRLASSMEEQRRLVDVLAGQLQAACQRQNERAKLLEAHRAEQQEYQLRLAGEAEVHAAYEGWQAARRDLERWDGVAANFRQVEQQRAAPLMAIESERSRLEQERQTLLAQDRAVTAASGRLPVLSEQLQQSQAQVSRLAAALNQRPVIEANLRQLLNDGTDALAENKHLRNQMNDLKERINRLKEIGGGICPICGQPLSPEEREALIASLEIQGRDMGVKFRLNQDLLRQSDGKRLALETELAGFPPLENDLRQQQRLVDQLESQQAQVEAALSAWKEGGAVRLKEVSEQLAEGAFAPQARAELARIDAVLKDLGYDAAAHDAVRQMEQEGRSSEEKLRGLETARAALGPLEREMKRLEEQLRVDAEEVRVQEAAYQLADQKYKADQATLPDLNQVETDLFHLQEQENRLRMQVGGARQAVQVLDTQRKRQAELNTRRESLSRQTGQLKVLERAFGKDGVPALLIEQALPEIEGQANEILDRLSGGNMSVRFATQKDFKDKSREDKRETLDIIITDASGPREYEMFSGGEAFRVNFAIRLALSRFLSQRAGARLQTLVIDEGFGSQDAEGRQRLIEAINLVRPDFAKILAITHMEELKEAFPVRVEVEKTPRGSRVQVIL
jgi:DNA repair protein SbcC/Rad50